MELSITNYQMRRPPMATHVIAHSDMPAQMVIHDSPNEYVKKAIMTAEALQKQGHLIINKDPAGTNYSVFKNFKGTVGTIYLRENRKIHFEIDSAYDEEIVIKAFFSKKIEKRHHVACVTGIIPFTFDHLIDVRLRGNTITFTYSLTPDGQGQRVQFMFEMPDVRQFAKDLYEWAEKKNFKIVKAVDEDNPIEPEKVTADEPAPPPEGVLYSALIEPDNQVIQFGTSIRFNIRPIDYKGNPVPVQSIKWSVDPSSIGTISPEGVFTPRTDNAKCSIVATVTSGQVTTSGFATLTIVPGERPRTQIPPAYGTQQMPTSGIGTAGGATNLGMVQQPAQPQQTPLTASSYSPQPPMPTQPQSMENRVCETCRGPLSFAEQQNRWYCPKCQTWQ